MTEIFPGTARWKCDGGTFLRLTDRMNSSKTSVSIVPDTHFNICVINMKSYIKYDFKRYKRYRSTDLDGPSGASVDLS